MDKDVIYVEGLDHDKSIENRKRVFDEAYKTLKGVVRRNMIKAMKDLMKENIAEQIKKAISADDTEK